MTTHAAGLVHYQRLFGSRRERNFAHMPRCRKVDRRSLPTPLRYLTERRLFVGKPRHEWAQIRCPRHKGGDERKPSLGVNLVDGHFRCHACGVKGGDIVALHMLVTAKRFRDAVADLGGRFHD